QFAGAPASQQRRVPGSDRAIQGSVASESAVREFADRYRHLPGPPRQFAGSIELLRAGVSDRTVLANCWSDQSRIWDGADSSGARRQGTGFVQERPCRPEHARARTALVGISRSAARAVSSGKDQAGRGAAARQTAKGEPEHRTRALFTGAGL